MGRDVGKGILAGVIGGLVGSVALRVWMTARSRHHAETMVPDQNGPAHQVAALVVGKVSGRELAGNERLVAGEIVHYLFGALTGGIYGAIAEYQPWTTAGGGVLFGTGVFVAADESSMPLLGLVPPPWTETLAAQAEHWAAHLVFGVAGEATRKLVRGRL